jgi:hypothetical protein
MVAAALSLQQKSRIQHQRPSTAEKSPSTSEQVFNLLLSGKLEVN